LLPARPAASPLAVATIALLLEARAVYVAQREALKRAA